MLSKYNNAGGKKPQEGEGTEKISSLSEKIGGGDLDSAVSVLPCVVVRTLDANSENSGNF